MSEPWVRYEDEHLLAVAKPAGVTTHRTDAVAQDGMYEWVQRQRPAAPLAIVHRLDKATSGVLLFGKTPEANRSLAAQFEQRTVSKRYELIVERDARRASSLSSTVPISRQQRGRPVDLVASTDFERVQSGPNLERFDARPHTGRTHQVRVHAAELGMPILGDAEHGGASAARLFLHAAGLGIEHPTNGSLAIAAERPASFDRVLAGTQSASASTQIAALVALEARTALFDPTDTNAYLWIDRHHDGFDNVRVERLGDVALVVNYDESARPTPSHWVDALSASASLRAIYEQRRPQAGGALPTLLRGTADPSFDVLELGARYQVDLEASSTSTGLFLDQRETRRELRSSALSGQTLLNAFAHTGSLSVAAALGGAQTLSLDLSKRYLEWAADNLRLNDVDPGDHDFIYGDAMEWMARLAKKGRRFDVVLVDPPSSSTPRKGRGGRWAVDRDLHMLVARATHLCASGGRLFVSTNLRRMTWPAFLDHINRGLKEAGRSGETSTRTLPLDHRSGPGDPPYLKAAWIQLHE
ncbi:MAG: pseudouridine synthase [Acidimicrobiales bacterium]